MVYKWIQPIYRQYQNGAIIFPEPTAMFKSF